MASRAAEKPNRWSGSKRRPDDQLVSSYSGSGLTGTAVPPDACLTGVRAWRVARRRAAVLTNQHLLQAFEAAGANHGLVYLSVPITSGRLEIAILDELGLSSEEFHRQHPDRWRDEVIRPNEEQARIIAEKVRASSPGVLVVDPSRMAVAGWEQDDYNGLWMKLLEEYATQVVASPGWHLSRGARGEVGYAISLGLPVVDLDGNSLSRDRVEALDTAAREELMARGWASTRVAEYLPPLICDSVPRLGTSAASQAFDWLVRERAYQVRKFGTELDDQHTREGLDDDGWWWRQLTSYYHRARVLGLQTGVGRQALAKFAATACGLLESVVRVHGPLPPPGVPSGQVTGPDA